jgi:hypothetical protein
MATEDVKKENLLRMTELSLEVLAAEVWDTLGESAIVLGKGMGDSILEMLQKEEGFEFEGESTKEIAAEIKRIFLDEFGFAKDIETEIAPDGKAVITVNSCINTKFTDRMLASGVKMNYTCPIMLTASTVLRRMGAKGRVSIERWPEGKGCKINFLPL